MQSGKEHCDHCVYPVTCGFCKGDATRYAHMLYFLNKSRPSQLWAERMWTMVLHNSNKRSGSTPTVITVCQRATRIQFQLYTHCPTSAVSPILKLFAWVSNSTQYILAISVCPPLTDALQQFKRLDYTFWHCTQRGCSVSEQRTVIRVGNSACRCGNRILTCRTH